MARVLIVLDGTYRFSIGTTLNPDFTYTTLVDALTAAGHEVTKAHRNGPTHPAGIDTSPGVLTDFKFATGNLLNYDVIWLIGWEGRNSLESTGNSTAGIDEPEIAAIARFMAEGGGVFATGDHDGIGNEMSGRIPRVRAMRSWFGARDNAPNKPANLPPNFPILTDGRADTTQPNPLGHYDDPPPPPNYVWFDNQSDSVPQPITPIPPTHPILRHDGADILVYPDHMHEGNTLGEVPGYSYTQTLTFVGESFVEFPAVPGSRELPRVIATGQTLPNASRNVVGGGFVGGEMRNEVSGPNTVNTLSVYDGRVAGVGRIVTGSTFHHYVDINLTGTSVVNTDALSAKVGPNARKGHGFNDAPPPVFAQIKAVFGNITVWLARPRPKIQIILERSTFSQDEATASPSFVGVILVIVDGLKPKQFPSEIASLAAADFQTSWAPVITPAEGTGLEITAIGVDSDDPTLPDRLQRLTFSYRVRFTDVGAAFDFMPPTRNIQVNAALTSPAVIGSLTDSAIIQLVKSANPFMLDLANNNETAWLSSDLRVFRAVAGERTLGKTLANNADRSQALQYLHDVLRDMTIDQFQDDISITQAGSALSPFPETTGTPRKVYNFAVARVRLNHAVAQAMNVRVFFRIVPAPTTAALTYHESMGVPIGTYKETPGANPIAVPGTDGAESQWVSFPCFGATRVSPFTSQTDPDNVKNISPTTSEISTFFGALLDNNLDDDYLPSVPNSPGAVSLPTLLMSEHQCIVAQIEYAGTSIPDAANPFTSDKLAQRNLAFSAVANPGLDASRVALHTFEIEATPHAIGDRNPPDELLLQWHAKPPEGIEVRLEISTWDASAVIELADRFYPRHEIRALDAHTIAVPGGGVRYVPIPRSNMRQTGVIAVHFPLGVKKGQRFDLSVRQVTTRGRQVDPPPPKATVITRAEAARILAELVGPDDNAPPERGVFELGENRVLITDLRVLDASGDHAVIVEHPDPAAVAAAVRQSGRWRETIGAFQLGIPVSVKADMLAHHLRLLSVLRWRAESLSPNNRWYRTFIRYVELNAEKVRALGGDPYSVPATPDGNIPLPGKDEEHADHDHVGCLACLLIAIRRLFRRA